VQIKRLFFNIKERIDVNVENRFKNDEELSGTINIVPLSFGENFDLLTLIEPVKRQFNYQVKSQDIYIDLSEYFDPERVQYSANDILHCLLHHAPGGQNKIIGLTGIDLFIPALTFIFGQAYLGGNAGIISTYRLRNEFYGMPGNDDIFFKRLNKTIIHELGHMFGLTHCHTMNCVMRSATYIEDIDQKEEYLCQSCQDAIQ